MESSDNPSAGIAPASSQPPRPRRKVRWLWTSGLLIVAANSVAALAWLQTNHQAPVATQPSASPSPSATPSPVVISAGPTPDAPLKLPDGYVVHLFAQGLGSARDLQFTPGGTLLTTSLDSTTVTALPDRNHDGMADEAKVIIRGGTNTHGLAFHNGLLYVAEVGRVVRYHWDEASLTATFDRELFTLPTPGGGHLRRTLVFDAAGHLYVSVGSTCNVCQEPDDRYATILQSDADGNNPHIFAAGLRNAPFMAANPTSGEIWATEMGRDELGDNVPPDEIDIIRPGAGGKPQNYGWPYCYDDRIHDTQFDKSATNPCGPTIPPIFKVPAHNAPLGLVFINSPQWPADQQRDLLVAYHGSWNRTVPDGYKVVRLHVSGNTITSSTDFITGFINGRSVAGRPVDLTFDTAGNLYVSDDKAGVVYIVQKSPITSPGPTTSPSH